MTMKVSSGNSSPNNSLKIKGDLGDLQISEDTSDGEDDNSSCDKQKVSRTISTLPNIPSSLVKPSTVPVFGSVSVTNSDNVQFGNNTYFNGPVTIKQVIQGKSGFDNPAFRDTENDLGGTYAKFHEKAADTPAEKLQILAWHKVTLSAICVTVIGGIIAIILILHNKFDHESTSTMPNFGSTGTTDSAKPTVLGYCSDNLQVIIIAISIIPLTLLLIFYSLLTREGHDIAQTPVKKTTGHENCLIKSCTICNMGGDPLIIAPGHLRIVSREDWLAQPVEGALDKLEQPVPWVIISHTATESCHTQSQCVLRVRLIQQFHVESRGWYDIGYNFMVGGDGSVYYGRGWDYEGAHTKYYNKYSIGIAFIGTFNNDPPSKQQVEACQKLIRLGVSLGKLYKEYRLLAHRQLMSTLSPGDKVYDIIKEWPHFVNNYTDVDELLPPNRRKSLENMGILMENNNPQKSSNLHKLFFNHQTIDISLLSIRVIESHTEMNMVFSALKFDCTDK